MKLYSGPLSLFSAKVRVALREKGLDAEIVSVPFSREHAYQPKHPDVVALNPKEQVPVWVDDEVQLYDSTIILEYLEDRHPDPRLYPVAPAPRARCRQLEAEADELLFPQVWNLIEEVFYRPDPAQRDARRIEATRAAIERIYRRFDGLLGASEHFCGGFSVADIGIFLTTSFAAGLGAAIPASCPGFTDWFARLGERPSLRAEREAMTAFAARL